MQNSFTKQSLFLLLDLIYFINILSCSSLISKETPELILKASNRYESERAQLKSYVVDQSVTSELVSGNVTTIDKRKQTGYFISPNSFVFIIKAREVNGSKIPLKKNESEKSTKKGLEWISSEELMFHYFTIYSETDSIAKFKVTPREVKPDSKKGEIWIHKESARILRMIKEPYNLEEGYEKYRTEIFFDKEMKFQEPTFTKLNAIIIKNGVKTEARVEALFDNYKFQSK